MSAKSSLNSGLELLEMVRVCLKRPRRTSSLQYRSLPPLMLSRRSTVTCARPGDHVPRHAGRRAGHAGRPAGIRALAWALAPMTPDRRQRVRIQPRSYRRRVP